MIFPELRDSVTGPCQEELHVHPGWPKPSNGLKYKSLHPQLNVVVDVDLPFGVSTAITISTSVPAPPAFFVTVATGLGFLNSAFIMLA